jgi:hypothetical protein
MHYRIWLILFQNYTNAVRIGDVASFKRSPFDRPRGYRVIDYRT